MSTASAIARMSSSFSGRNTMTSSNLTRNMTPLWIGQKHGKLVFFTAKSCLAKHLLRKQPVEEFWSEETLHLLKQLKVRCKMTCEKLNDNAMLGIWRSHCSLFVTPLWSFVKFMNLVVVYLCFSVQTNAPHPLLPSPSHRCQSHPPGIDIDWLEASRTSFHMFSSCFHLISICPFFIFPSLSIPFHPSAPRNGSQAPRCRRRSWRRSGCRCSTSWWPRPDFEGSKNGRFFKEEIL